MLNSIHLSGLLVQMGLGGDVVTLLKTEDEEDQDEKDEGEGSPTSEDHDSDKESDDEEEGDQGGNPSSL